MAIPIFPGTIVGVEVQYKNVGYAPITLCWRVSLHQHGSMETWIEGGWTGDHVSAVGEQAGAWPEIDVPNWGPGLKDIRVDVAGDVNQDDFIRRDSAFEVVAPNRDWIQVVSAVPYVAG